MERGFSCSLLQSYSKFLVFSTVFTKSVRWSGTVCLSSPYIWAFQSCHFLSKEAKEWNLWIYLVWWGNCQKSPLFLLVNIHVVCYMYLQTHLLCQLDGFILKSGLSLWIGWEFTGTGFAYSSKAQARSWEIQDFIGWGFIHANGTLNFMRVFSCWFNTDLLLVFHGHCVAARVTLTPQTQKLRLECEIAIVSMGWTLDQLFGLEFVNSGDVNFKYQTDLPPEKQIVSYMLPWCETSAYQHPLDSKFLQEKAAQGPQTLSHWWWTLGCQKCYPDLSQSS